MSMLTRKGTIRIARGSQKRGSGKNRPSSSTGTSTGSVKSNVSNKSGNGSVSGRRHGNYYQNSPARSIGSTVVSFDDEHRLCKTSVSWNARDVDEGILYDSTYLQVQEAKKDSENVCEFAERTYDIICRKACVTVLVGVSAALPVTMMSVGMKYLDECPKEEKVPIYLLVGGCFGLVKVLCTVWSNIYGRRHDDMDVLYEGQGPDSAAGSRTYRVMNTFLTLFLIVWLVLGTLWVFSIWQPNYTLILHEPSNWCDRTVYLFAVYHIIGSYVLLVIMLLIFFCLSICFRCS